jgi:cytochrome c55X
VRDAVAAIAIGTLLTGAVFAAPASDGAVSRARASELKNLVRQDCGSCHGLTLRGGLGPALTPEALAGKSPEALALTILHGRAGTPMPPWKPFLTEVEAQWIVQSLQQGFPNAP